MTHPLFPPRPEWAVITKADCDGTPLDYYRVKHKDGIVSQAITAWDAHAACFVEEGDFLTNGRWLEWDEILEKIQSIDNRLRSAAP